MVAQAVRNCAVHLAAGVTTLRDNGSRGATAIAVRDAANDGLFPAPRILASGPPVTPTGGHFAWCGGAADGIDGVRAAVRGLLARGADFVKVMASGGGTAGSRPDRAGFGQGEMRTIVESAHDLGLLTTAHCRATEGIERAVAAGIDCIEHAEFLHPSGEARFDPAVAEAIAASPSFVSPTMQAFGHYRLQLLTHDESQRALTQAEQAMQDRLQRHLDNHLRIMELLVPLVGPERFVYGSDAGPGFTAFGEVRWGLELMIRSGMTARQALHSVTGVAARAIGLGGSVGELRDGQRADLLLVRGDPDQDVRAIGDVIGVIQNGRPVHIADAATFWKHVQLIDQEEG
jgi:imidazolonepropionase-like amidohydrolase